MIANITFVILNYETYWETMKCIQSIYEKLQFENNIINIVVVDNGSKNDSVKKLKEKYEGITNIYIIESQDNLGFAKGNNIGFLFAKNNLEPDFILMINSDIIITDDELIKKLYEASDYLKFGVAGPNVVSQNGKLLNPMISDCIDSESVDERIKNLRKQMWICKHNLEVFHCVIKRMKATVRKYIISGRQNCEQKTRYLDIKRGEMLHGCFLIFSKEYISLFDGIYDKTFLYGEEILLRLRCERINLNMLFIKEINAFHNESKTDKYINKSLTKRHLKNIEYTLRSLCVVKEYMINENLL